MTAWRGVALAWLTGNLLKAGLRSRGDEERFRTETRRSIERLGGGLPGTWVFVPVGLAVGGVAAVAMLLAAEGDGFVAAAATFAACAGYGLLLRRLARSGLLPIPAE